MAVQEKDTYKQLHEIFYKALDYQTIPKKHIDEIFVLLEYDYKIFSKALKHILLIILPISPKISKKIKCLKIFKAIIAEIKNRLLLIE